MPAPKKLLFVAAALLLCSAMLHAQNGGKFREPAPDLRNPYVDNCRLCDSLSMAYLLEGDTATATYYYQQYMNAISEEEYNKSGRIHRSSADRNNRQSFYLTGY